ncbi:MAG: Flp pilus assembly complex ATPase component TadA [Candidatus Omnitrophica bacterium]|nr:Flp pilus assembly complex ATPase component TadA [Candidatus Omnitrophota bacterium]
MPLRIGDILVEKKIITQEELDLAVKEHQNTKEFLGQALVRLNIITEEKLLKVLAEQQGVKFLNLKEMKIADKVIESVPAKFAWHYKIMPIRIDGNVLTVAISNPFDMWPIDDLETNLGYRVEIALAVASDITDAIRKYYGVGADTIERILAEAPKTEVKEEEGGSQEKVQDLETGAEDASVVKLVNQILQQAISDRATDIHLEHYRDELLLRYRVDGVLYDTQVSENIKYLYPAIVSRIKVMANLNIVERRIPQDGRAKAKIGDKEYELRISIIPTLYGENIVIRILSTLMLLSIKDLGMEEKEIRVVEGLLAKPHGIIFVTGPTGSGKTTTLYTCLSKLNTRERKIITIEDPVEYELRGVSQIQVNPKIDLTFAAALRSILRHDPDVIMVGEVRDTETAQITIQTALTGHLVFSTIHTNTAAGGATRLVDMGIDPFLITSSVEAFIAQRLVRVICPECKTQVTGETLDIGETLPGIDPGRPFYRGKGCPSCNNTGYKGRAGIYEILVMNEAIRELILKKASSDVIERRSREMGVKSLAHSGWEKVFAGVTTPEEVRRVTQIEE